VYILFAIVLIGMLLMGFILSARQRNNARHLEEEIRKLRERVEDLDFTSPAGGEVMNLVNANELRKRLEALEANMLSYLQQFDDRLGKTERNVASATTQSGTAGVDKAAFEDMILKVAALQGKVALMDANTKNTAAPADPTQEFRLDAVEALSQAVEEVARRARIEPLMIACRNMQNSLQQALKRQSMGGIDPKLVAYLIQLAWVDAINTDHYDSYRKLVSCLQPFGYSVEDSMQGRMAFSDYYAQNVPFRDFLELEAVQSEDFPDHRIAQNLILTSPQYQEAVSGMVLLTLKPAIIRQTEGAKSVLLKGVYVVAN
jgi:hypothetical protein